VAAAKRWGGAESSLWLSRSQKARRIWENSCSLDKQTQAAAALEEGRRRRVHLSISTFAGGEEAANIEGALFLSAGAARRRRCGWRTLRRGYF